MADHRSKQGAAHQFAKLSRRGFARRMAELAGGAAFAALAGGNTRVSAAQRGAPVAHTYCVPGEVLAVVRHPGAFTREHVAQRLHAYPLLGDALFAGAAPDAKRMITLASGADTWTLAALPAPGANDAATLLDHCERLSADALAAPVGEVTIVQLVPNWMAAGAPENTGGGGPGGRPQAISAAELAQLRSAQPAFWQFALPAGLRLQRPAAERGAGIDIYILDTAPDRAALDGALARWQAAHPLVAALLGSNSPLDIAYAGADHLLGQLDYVLPDAHYLMPDHGLFVAGIIHAIAPAARLHLVEVLNPYGVGSLESIARGFALAAQAAARGPVIVNASLCLDVPQPDRAWLRTLRKDEPFWASQPPERLARTITPFQQLCDALHSQQAAVVAAAGNEGRAGYHPPARYPAAFESVLGVGALKADAVTPADYSNLSDAPLRAGVAAFGGEVTAGTADGRSGMVGMYTGAFPDGAANETGWARWAGTSFAAPVVAGALAALMSDGHARDAAIQLLRRAGQSSTSPIGAIFPARQMAQ